MDNDNTRLADVGLDTLKGGAALELWAYEFAKVLANIADLNTDPEAVREITLKVAIKPSADRDAAAVVINCKANKLAGVRGAGATIYLGARGADLVAVEYDPAQAQLFDSDAGADIMPLSVVTATGETTEG